MNQARKARLCIAAATVIVLAIAIGVSSQLHPTGVVAPQSSAEE